jgi:hypothetical protein
MLVRDVAEIIEGYAPRSAGVPGDQLGLLAGDPDSPLLGVVTCWSPTLTRLPVVRRSRSRPGASAATPSAADHACQSRERAAGP